MKRILTLLSLITIFSGPLWPKAEVMLGEEYIEPLKYPKFSLSGEYAMGRKFHGFADERARLDLPKRFEGILSFDMSLHKHLNAGALMSFSFANVMGNEPIDLRLGLFLRPLIPLSDRLAIFGRLSLGLSSLLSIYPPILYFKSLDKDRYLEVYKDQFYDGYPWGGFGAASIGIEFFPFTRFGIALEGGIRASLLRASRSMPMIAPPANVEGAPQAVNFMLYEFPLALTLHVIL